MGDGEIMLTEWQMLIWDLDTQLQREKQWIHEYTKNTEGVFSYKSMIVSEIVGKCSRDAYAEKSVWSVTYVTREHHPSLWGFGRDDTEIFVNQRKVR